jgi:hypothetical protein
MSDFAPTQQEISNIIDPQDTTVVLVDGTNPAYKAVINSSGALLVTGSSGTFQVKDNSAAVLGTDLACIIAGYDGTNYQFLSVDSSGHLEIKVNSFEGELPPLVVEDMTSWLPAPQNFYPGTFGHLYRDINGQLQIRGPVLSDEASFRDDFTNTGLADNLTGTVTFTNGSTTVTGSGTAFLTEISSEFYLRLSSHAEGTYVPVVNVLSDTELELESPYTGANGSGIAVKSRWVATLLTGGSVSVSSSQVQLICNTTNGAKATINRFGDYPPYVIGFSTYLSQRIANQESQMGLVDDPLNISAQTIIFFSGTDNTKVGLRTSWTSADIEETIFSLPGGLTTASKIEYQLEINVSRVTLTANGVFIGEHKLHIPGPYQSLVLHVNLRNTAATASTTTVYIDTFYFINFDQLQVVSTPKNDPISVRMTEDEHHITGVLTTTTTTVDQVLISYTVPTGKALWILGYSVNNGETAIRGNPVKIGKNTITSEPASPGILDNNILRTFNMPQSSIRSEDFSGMPRRLGNAGDVIKVTVTPSGVTSTIWRASLDFILR